MDTEKYQIDKIENRNPDLETPYTEPSSSSISPTSSASSISPKKPRKTLSRNVLASIICFIIAALAIFMFSISDSIARGNIDDDLLAIFSTTLHPDQNPASENTDATDSFNSDTLFAEGILLDWTSEIENPPAVDMPESQVSDPYAFLQRKPKYVSIPKVDPIIEKVSSPVPYALWQRDHLSDDDKNIYDAIFNGFNTLTETIVVPSCDKDRLSRAFNAVLGDYPEIFWISNQYSYGVDDDETSVIMIRPTYTYEYKDIISSLETIRNIKNEILESIPKELEDETSRAHYLYKYLAGYFTYDISMAEKQDLASAMKTGATVCGGYAKTYQYLLRSLNINSIYILGTSIDTDGSSEFHAWNGLILDGRICYADITWGDKGGFENANDLWFARDIGEFKNNHLPYYPDIIPA